MRRAKKLSNLLSKFQENMPTNSVRVYIMCLFQLQMMASLARLERATHCLEGSCSILLSYRDKLHVYLA